MKCTIQKRLARVGANFGVSFLTPLIGINISNSIMDGQSVFIITILQSFLASVIFTGLSVSREVKDWSEK